MPAPRTPGAPIAADTVRERLRSQLRALLAGEADIAAGTAEGIHEMRVATRRLRSALRTYAGLYRKGAVQSLQDLESELSWLGAVLGVGRDAEVIGKRLADLVRSLPEDEIPREVYAALDRELAKGAALARESLGSALESRRCADLISTLGAFAEDAPMRRRARRPAREILPGLVRRDLDRLVRRVAAAGETPGPDRDVALHRARKAAKRARYAAEAAGSALGDDGRRLVASTKQIQELLGEHQDAVVAAQLLRRIGASNAADDNPGAGGFDALAALEDAAAASAVEAFEQAWSETSRLLRRSLR